jgi:hypothetical protein
VTESRMAVLHLSTGHVVGAVALGDRVPTVAEATGAAHVTVRPSAGLTVRVPAEILTALPVPTDPDVLTRPTHYAVTKAVPPVAWMGAPRSGDAVPAKPGREVLSIWDGGTRPEVALQSLDKDGNVPQDSPPGATHRLIAVAGEPLMHKP